VREGGFGDAHHVTVPRLMCVERDQPVVGSGRVKSSLDDGLVEVLRLFGPAYLLEVLSLEEAFDELDVVHVSMETRHRALATREVRPKLRRVR
jgi:hypothetical protein